MGYLISHNQSLSCLHQNPERIEIHYFPIRLPATDTTFRRADKWEGRIIWSTLGLISWLSCGPTWARMLRTGVDSDPNLTYKSPHLKIMLEHCVPTLGCNQPGSMSAEPCGSGPAKSWLIDFWALHWWVTDIAPWHNLKIWCWESKLYFPTQEQASGPRFMSYCQKMPSCRSCFFLLLP